MVICADLQGRKRSFVPALFRAGLNISVLLAAGCGSEGFDSTVPAQLTAAATWRTAEPANRGDSAAVRTEPDELSVWRNVPHVEAVGVVELPARDTEATYHEVKPDETLSGIARKYGTSAERLRMANGLDATTPVQPGQLVFIPKSS